MNSIDSKRPSTDSRPHSPTEGTEREWVVEFKEEARLTHLWVNLQAAVDGLSWRPYTGDEFSVKVKVDTFRGLKVEIFFT